jgi:hypothetical protein
MDASFQVDASPDEAMVATRFEALGRAIGQRFKRSTYACLIAVAVVTVAWTLVAVPLIVLAFISVPFVALSVAIAGYAVAVILLPSALQLAVMSRDDLALGEGYNVYAMLEQQHAPSLPRFLLAFRMRSANSTLKWMDTHPTFEPQRIRALMWAGRLADASERIERLPSERAEDRFQKEVLRALMSFLLGREAGLAAAFREAEAIQPGSERLYAEATLAIETARRLQDSGGDWARPVIELRRRLTSLPRGASYRDRLMAGIPAVLGAVVVGSIFGVLITFTW